MKNNLDYLIEQFKKAKDIKTTNIYSKTFVKEFSHWLKQMQIMGEEYINYLNYLGLNYTNSTCAEVGKGEQDTLVKGFDTKIISYNTNDITGVSTDRLIKGNVRFKDGNSYLYNGQNNIKEISNLQVSTFMIQNPYSYKTLTGISDVHNSGNHNIILGVYGSAYDKDKYKKIEQLKLIKNQLNSDYIEEYDVYDDSYFYILGSVNHKKRTKGY